MDFRDDDLKIFEAEGAEPLPQPAQQGEIAHDGARIWYADHGAGPPVILLHGGLGNSGNWGYQLPALIDGGYRVIVIDSRGHGRSTADARPYSYTVLASDVLAVMDALALKQAALVGWSDGACTSLILARHHPERVAGVLFFGCNMDASGTKEFQLTPEVERCFSRHKQDYGALSATPDQFESFVEAVGLMQRTQPNYTADDLAAIHVPVRILHADHDEFILRDHADYLVRTIPEADFDLLPDVSHFAPIQRPALFNAALLAFVQKLRW